MCHVSLWLLVTIDRWLLVTCRFSLTPEKKVGVVETKVKNLTMIFYLSNDLDVVYCWLNWELRLPEMLDLSWPQSFKCLPDAGLIENRRLKIQAFE